MNEWMNEWIINIIEDWKHVYMYVHLGGLVWFSLMRL
jgi:hypothetical protein